MNVKDVINKKNMISKKVYSKLLSSPSNFLHNLSALDGVRVWKVGLLIANAGFKSNMFLGLIATILAPIVPTNTHSRLLFFFFFCKLAV